VNGVVNRGNLPVYPTTNRWSNTVGILLIVAGLLAIFLPLVAGVAVTAIVGWLLLFAGGAHLLYTWSSRGAGAVLWQLIIGVLYVFVAIYLIAHPERGLLTLTLLLAAYFVVEGVVELVTYARLRSNHRANWFLWDGLITLLLGIFIWSGWPFSSVWALGTLVGISLISSGIARMTFRHGQPALGVA
jgi:uncharacterized membrane protein HdeD (DUF308 family)